MGVRSHPHQNSTATEKVVPVRVRMIEMIEMNDPTQTQH